jgi:hypothetical protein
LPYIGLTIFGLVGIFIFWGWYAAWGAAAPGQAPLVDLTPHGWAPVRVHLVMGTPMWAYRWGTTSGGCGYCMDGGFGLDVGPDVREERFDVVGGRFTAVADQH